MIDFERYEEFGKLRKAWNTVRIVRAMPYSLFTFGETELPYYLVCEARPERSAVTVRRGVVRVTRPLIIIPAIAPPELQNFFEDPEQEETAKFLLERTFSNVNFANRVGSEEIITSSVEEAVERIRRELDAQDLDRVAILTAPPQHGGLAVFRYAFERIVESLPDNLSELGERGFLP